MWKFDNNKIYYKLQEYVMVGHQYIGHLKRSQDVAHMQKI